MGVYAPVQTVWTSYTPSLSSITLGNGTLVGKYYQVGKKVTFRIHLTFGTTTSITGGFPTLSLPLTSATDTLTGMADMVFLDSGTNNFYGRIPIGSASTAVAMAVINVGGTYASESGVSATVPFTWTTGDRIQVIGTYEAA